MEDSAVGVKKYEVNILLNNRWKKYDNACDGVDVIEFSSANKILGNAI